MLGVAMYTTIETLYKRGLNKSEISRATSHDWKTVDKVLKHLKSGKVAIKKPHPSKLDQHKEQILEYLDNDLSGVRIHELLISKGCSISYSSVRNYIRDIKGKEDVCVRFHTLPGEESQVDFGYVGRLPDSTGKIKKAWVFNMRLSYSRLDFYKVVFDQTVETFIKCHIEAFKYFGGVPEYVKIDNLKAAVLEANFYQPIYQTSYKKLAEHYGFQIMPCRVRKPQEKGKVESGIKFIKNNFFAGRKFSCLKDLHAQLLDWLEYRCNSRLHGTTRKVPKELFEEKEIPYLKSLPSLPFRQTDVMQRKVYRDCHVYIEYNYYSVPFEYVGKIVDIEIDDNLVKLYYDGLQIALHKRLDKRGEFSTTEAHYPRYKLPFSLFSKQRLNDKMQSIGENAHKLFLLLQEKQPNHWYRTSQGILSLQKHFSNNIIDLACKRALSFGAIQYRQIKSICDSGSYNLPLCKMEVA